MSVNIIAILLAAVSSMIVGTIWFLPSVFGNRWQALTGVDPNTPKNRGLVYTLAFLAAVVTAAVLAGIVSLVHATLGGSYLLVALGVAAALWLGFTAATSAVHYLFEGRSKKIFAINTFHQLVTVLIMAVIIGLFG